MKYENLAMEIKNIWKLNNVIICSLVISVEGAVTKTSYNTTSLLSNRH
jgi:hypothetical protein